MKQHIVGVVLIVIIMVCFAVDLFVTVSTIIKFNKRLKLMNEIAAKLKVVSNEIGENVYENVMNALERKEEFKDTHTELLDELEEKKENISNTLQETKEKLSEAAEKAKLKKEQEELLNKYRQLYEKKNLISSRLMKAFPDMKSKDHNEILQKLKIKNLRKSK